MARLRPDSLVIRNRDDYGTGILKNIFINTLKKVYTVTVACEITGIRRSSVYQWRREDQEFATRWDDAIALAEDSLESAAYLKLADAYQDRRRRLNAPEERLTEFLLTGMKPEKYRQRIAEIEITQLNLTIDWASVPDNVLNAFNQGDLTLQDVYEVSLQSEKQTQSNTGEDRRTEGSGAT